MFSTVTPKVLMVNLEIEHCTAELASPTIAAEDLFAQQLAQLVVRLAASPFR